MGAECPNGHGRQNVIVQITGDHSDPKKASEVVAWKLQCGCTVGGKEYEEFKAASSKIDLDRSEAIRKINETARQKKAAAYEGFVLARSDAHAE